MTAALSDELIKEVETFFSKEDLPKSCVDIFVYNCNLGKKLTDKEEILSYLQAIEEINFLGALYIAIMIFLDEDKKEKYEEEIACLYAREFIYRHRDTIKNVIKNNALKHRTDETINEDNVLEYLQSLLLCLELMDEEEAAKVAFYVLENNYTYKNVGNLARAIFDAMRGIPDPEKNGIPRDILEKHKFLRAFKALREGLSLIDSIEDFIPNRILNKLEYQLSQRPLLNMPDIFEDVTDWTEEKNYFNYLVEIEEYNGATNFLNRCIKNRETLFDGMTFEKLKDITYRLPSSDLIGFTRYYAKLCGINYSYETFCTDVLERNEDSNIVAWAKLSTFYRRLAKIVEKVEDEKKSWDEFYEALADVKDYSIFEIFKITDYKSLVEDFAYIINTLLNDENQRMNIVKVLEIFGNLNINKYEYRKAVCNWNRCNDVRDCDYTEISKALLSKKKMDLTAKELLSVYMNTHLKYVIPIEDIAFEIKRRESDDNKIEIMFMDYPIEGVISKGSSRGSVRDKLFISPLPDNGIKYSYDYKLYKDKQKKSKTNKWDSDKELKNIYSRLIRCDEKWYSKNIGIAELFRNTDKVQFCISKIVNTGYESGIYAVDLEFLDKYHEKRRIDERDDKFPRELNGWLNRLIEEKRFIEYPKSSCFAISYVYNNVEETEKQLETINLWSSYKPEDRELAKEILYKNEITSDMKTMKVFRKYITFKILRVIEALAENAGEDDVRRFLFAITNNPLEKINEFRYVGVRASWKFPKDLYRPMIEAIRTITERIMTNGDISSELKCDIYLNTCIHKYYDLRGIYEYIGEGLENRVELLFLPLYFYKRDNKNTRRFFFRSAQDSFLFCLKDDSFVYEAENDEKAEEYANKLIPEQSYFVTIGGVLRKEDRFWLDDIALSKDHYEPWNNYLSKIRDIRKSKSSNTLKNDIESFYIDKKVKIKNKEQLHQLAIEMAILWNYRKYDLSYSYDVLYVIGNTNPFLADDIDFGTISEEENIKYEEAYNGFLEKASEGSLNYFYQIYNQSFLKCYKNKTQLKEDLLKIGKTEEEINSVINKN